jgi:hypothetical protein
MEEKIMPGILVFVVLAVCQAPEVPMSQWSVISAYSSRELAEKSIVVDKKQGCTYSIHEVPVEAEGEAAQETHQEPEAAVPTPAAEQ